MDENKPDLDWAAQFDDAPARPPHRAWGKLITLSVLFGGGAIAAIILLLTALAQSSAEESGAVPSRTPAATPRPSITQTAISETSLLPAGCGGLYSEAMSVTLGQLGFALDADYDGDWHSGSADTELRALLEDAQLDCYWSDGSAGMLTKVAEVGDQQQALAIARLEQLGFTQLEEHGGVRYFVENQSATGATGESHFFREGVWFATHWRVHGQYGYTADMVRTVFQD